VLTAHRAVQNERRLRLGAAWTNTDQRVFCGPTGAPLDPDAVSKRWKALNAAHAGTMGLATLRFHDLRHSHCQQLLDAGVRADIVTERLGHASVAFTLSTYTHRFEGDQQAALARLRAAL
jgi:integrase